MTQRVGRQDLEKALQDKLASLAEEQHLPGAAVGITFDGEEHYAFYGVTSAENPLSVNADTLFQIGSTTKTFTGTAVMRLVDDGRVRLDAPVRTYVPELKLQDESAAASVTVLQILNHTAGWDGDFFEDTGLGEDAITRYVEKMAHLRQVNPPGMIASYNNAALVLAGRLIEKVTGKGYEIAIKELVLEPLGLNHTWFFAGDIMTRRFAVGHEYRESEQAAKVLRPAMVPRSSNPAGGLWSTAQDQIRWARYHLGQALPDALQALSAEARALMQKPSAEVRGGVLGNAVGVTWWIRDAGGYAVLAHGGSTNGQQSAFEFMPDQQFAITVLTNANSGIVVGKELVDWAREAYLGIVPAKRQALELDEAALVEYAGVYAADLYKVTITHEAGNLWFIMGYTEEGIEQMRAVSSEPPEAVPPFAVQLIGEEQYDILDGRFKGMQGRFQRREGKIIGVDVGGRLAMKQ